ncbi:MAG: response regulator [Pirellulaceae bacterium]
MTKRVLDVGNCDYDHGRIRRLIESSFQAQVVRCHGASDALAELQRQPADLVLVNRILDLDQTEGLSIIETIKSDPQLRATRCMLLTNYPEFQATAVAAGAEPGFGKGQLAEEATRKRLAQWLAD